jgi:ribosome-associated translation inhibitor RaiA
MKVPLEIAYRDVKRNDGLTSLIEEKTAKLEKYCDYINSCRVAIEMPSKGRRSGNHYLIRLDITVPPGHEILIKQQIQEGEASDALSSAVRDAFNAAGRRLQEFVERQREEVKIHPEQEVNGWVTGLKQDEGFGFNQSLEGHKV